MIRDKLKYGPLRVGIGGPVGAGKTSMTEALCKRLASDISMAVITNDIYTKEDADYLVRSQVLSSDRICGVLKQVVVLIRLFEKMRLLI